MSVIAQWGPKTWAIDSQQIVAIQDLSFSYSASADNNTSTEDKKTTNERGMDLFPLNFTTTLHSGTGVDVMAEIESWQSLVTETNYFYLGGKQLGPMLQLRKVSISNVKIDDLGRIRLATLSFEFKEHDSDTTKVKVNTSAMEVKASAEMKTQKKITNSAVKKAPKITIKIGDYVKLTGSKYLNGQAIPASAKQRNHKVIRINERQNKVLLSSNGDKNWVSLNEITLV